MDFLLNNTLTDSVGDVTTQDPRSRGGVFLQAASMVAIILVALGGNLLILAAIYIDKTLQTITNAFIINLACADLLLTMIGMPFTLASSITYDWIFGDKWCKVNVRYVDNEQSCRWNDYLYMVPCLTYGLPTTHRLDAVHFYTIRVYLHC